MKKQLKIAAVTIGCFISVIFLVFIINQTAGLYNMASELNQVFGKIVLFALLFIYILLLIGPVVFYLRLPKKLDPPEDKTSKEYDEYLRCIKANLDKNPRVKANKKLLEGFEDNKAYIENALKILHKEADRITKETSSVIFLTTAVSQNGVFDFFVVLTTQLRMIWKVMIVYNQRPNLREIVKLYINVAATALMARGIEDMDLINNQLEPIIASLVGTSLSSAVPGINLVSTIVANSIIEGSSNAFLTLRMGIIAKNYSMPFGEKNKSIVKRSASLAACYMLGSVVIKSATTITKNIRSYAIKRIKNIIPKAKNTNEFEGLL